MTEAMDRNKKLFASLLINNKLQYCKEVLNKAVRESNGQTVYDINHCEEFSEICAPWLLRVVNFTLENCSCFEIGDNLYFIGIKNIEPESVVFSIT